MTIASQLTTELFTLAHLALVTMEFRGSRTSLNATSALGSAQWWTYVQCLIWQLQCQTLSRTHWMANCDLYQLMCMVFFLLQFSALLPITYTYYHCMPCGLNFDINHPWNIFNLYTYIVWSWVFITHAPLLTEDDRIVDHTFQSGMNVWMKLIKIKNLFFILALSTICTRWTKSLCGKAFIIVVQAVIYGKYHPVHEGVMRANTSHWVLCDLNLDSEMQELKWCIT